MAEPKAAPAPVASPTTDPSLPSLARTDESGEVHLIYQIEGKSDEVPAFELSRALEALGNLIHEGDKVVNADRHHVLVRVKPFQEGSFIMDLVLSVQNNPTVLFFLAHPEAIDRIKKVLEYIGFIKKGSEIYHSVLEVVEFLKNGKPEKVEPAGPEVFNYYNQDGQMMPVNQPIHQLINNGTIQQFIFSAVGAPLERDVVEAVRTFLPKQENETEVRVRKSDAKALKAYSEPPPAPLREETVQNETVSFVNPRAGTYGDTNGVWTFTFAGTNREPFRARIIDESFLAKYARGVIRFYHGDLLKVRLKTEQRVKNGKSKFTHEITEVLDYKSAPVRRQRRSVE